MKTIRSQKEYTEITLDEAKNMLASDHRVLKIANTFGSFKKLNQTLTLSSDIGHPKAPKI